MLTASASALQPTCKDFDVTTNKNDTWACPQNTVPNPANDMATPPSNETCCMVSIWLQPGSIYLHMGTYSAD